MKAKKPWAGLLLAALCALFLAGCSQVEPLSVGWDDLEPADFRAEESYQFPGVPWDTDAETLEKAMGEGLEHACKVAGFEATATAAFSGEDLFRWAVRIDGSQFAQYPEDYLALIEAFQEALGSPRETGTVQGEGSGAELIAEWRASSDGSRLVMMPSLMSTEGPPEYVEITVINDSVAPAP